MRIDNFEYNKLKFFSYIIKNYNNFNFSEVIQTIDKKKERNCTKEAKENLAKKRRTLNKPLDFVDCLCMNFFDIYNVTYDTKRMKRTFINILEYTFAVYCLIQKLPKKYLEQEIILPKDYDKKLIKNILNFLFTNNYLIIYEKKDNNIVCSMLRLGSIKHFNKLFNENYEFSTITSINIDIIDKNFGIVTAILDNKEIQVNYGVLSKKIQKIEKSPIITEANPTSKLTARQKYNKYSKTIRDIYELLENVNTQTCFLCYPVKQDNIHRCCSNCNSIINRFAKLSGRKVKSVRRSLKNIATKEKRYEYLRYKMYIIEKQMLRNNTDDQQKKEVETLNRFISRIYGDNI